MELAKELAACLMASEALEQARRLATEAEARHAHGHPKERIDAYIRWCADTYKPFLIPGVLPDQILAWVKLNRALRLALAAFPNGRQPVPQRVRLRLIARYRQTCQYCGGRGGAHDGPDGKTWHIDHIVPVAAGGRNEESNLTLSCATCNLKKWNHFPWDNATTATEAQQ